MEGDFNPAALEPGVTTETDRTIVELFKRLIVDKELAPSYIAEQINCLLLSSLLTCGDTKEDELVSTFLWNLWVLLIQIVQECPVSQLEGVIEVLRELRGISSRVVNQWGSNRHVWEDLPYLGSCLRDDWQGPVQFEDETAGSAEKRWIRLNSFAARMLGRSWTDLGLLHLAVWELRDTLEENVDKADLPIRVSVVNEWISHAGSVLFNKIHEPAADDKGGGTDMKPGELYRGNLKTTPERWIFWKQRLGDIGISYGGDVAEQAVATAGKMDEIEKRLANPNREGM